eukprot:PITA_29779
MKLLSFNYHGVASPNKKLVLKHLFASEKIDIIFLQETLGSASVVSLLLDSWLPGWSFHSLDASSRSGGLTLGIWNRTIKTLNVWGGRGFLGADIYSPTLESNFRILNVYGPCQDRMAFWRPLLNLSLLHQDNIIIGGDLNFSLGYSEYWGNHAQVDAMTGFYQNLLESHNFIDVPSAKKQPTWKNNRVGEASLARRLDHFLTKEALTNGARDRFLEGTPSRYIGGHNSEFPPQHEGAKELIQDLGSEEKGGRRINPQGRRRPFFSFEKDSRGVMRTKEQKDTYSASLQKRTQVLRNREANWRFRSRATWLKEGYDNTKFFHKHANGKKAINTIWELKDLEGTSVHSFRELVALACSHFQNIYKSPPYTSLAEVMRTMQLFPGFVEQEMNRS